MQRTLTHTYLRPWQEGGVVGAAYPAAAAASAAVEEEVAQVDAAV